MILIIDLNYSVDLVSNVIQSVKLCDRHSIGHRQRAELEQPFNITFMLTHSRRKCINPLMETGLQELKL